MLTLVPRCDPEPMPRPAAAVLSSCPQCAEDLTVLRVIPGKAGAEYWAMRCVSCGGIHLDIVNSIRSARTHSDPADLRA